LTFLSTLKKQATVAGDVLNSKGDLLSRSSSALARLAVGSNGKVLTAASGESTGLEWAYSVQSFIIACSDETTLLTTGTKVTFRLPYAFTLTAVRASLTTAATGGDLLTVDINEAGSTILSTKITIDASETTSVSAATPPVISDTALADNAQITIDIDQVGNTAAGKGLKVALIGYKT
jgi:hypothetical protein|tara:strand:+ start:230 stop:763 length:534 start_codon:yes stop_codon:yes gene_type:complete